MRLAADGEAMLSGGIAVDPEASKLLAGAKRENARLKGFEEEILAARWVPPELPRSAAAQDRLRAVALKARADIVPPRIRKGSDLTRFTFPEMRGWEKVKRVRSDPFTRLRGGGRSRP
ncbi:MAG: hypothetical protein M0D55_05575 [Elusimicrobiota bacterium]|nr:MAG: hypothetical protein M0D55_05575 [Elusimicrobiota bacterium]